MTEPLTGPRLAQSRIGLKPTTRECGAGARSGLGSSFISINAASMMALLSRTVPAVSVLDVSARTLLAMGAFSGTRTWSALTTP